MIGLIRHVGRQKVDDDGFVSPCFRQCGDAGVPFADADCQGETFSTCQDLKLIRSFHSLWSSLNHGPSGLRLRIPADHF